MHAKEEERAVQRFRELDAGDGVIRGNVKTQAICQAIWRTFCSFRLFAHFLLTFR